MSQTALVLIELGMFTPVSANWGSVDPIYPLFARADRRFYDTPTRRDRSAVQAFEPSRTRSWASWRSATDENWTSWTPNGYCMPEQGWKIHASATPATAERIIFAVSDYCHQAKLAFKHLSDEARLLDSLSKDADRRNSGKFITIYPRDEHSLRQCLESLDSEIGGLAGPYILSDLRWRDGPLFVRYGAFIFQTVMEDGFEVPAIRDLEQDRLVPDVRATAFHLPSWVLPPAFLQTTLDARDALPPAGFPEVTGALHYSNAGGVYTAVMNNEPTVLKEARPYTGLTPDGRDAVTRLRHEEHVIGCLRGAPATPRIVGAFDAHGHRYLGLEHITGKPLSRLLLERNPLVLGNSTRPEIRAYATWATSLCQSLREAVQAMHDAGWSHGDLHPGNVLVSPDDTLTIIDYEMASPADSDDVAAFGVPGFVPLERRGAAATDRYAIACIELHLFLPLTPLIQLGRTKASELVDHATSLFELPAGWADHVLEWLAVPIPTCGDDLGSEAAPQMPRSPDGGGAHVDTIAGVVGALKADCDPSRPDRLWPGDPTQFDQAAYGLASGALGIATVLSDAGVGIPGEPRAWIERSLHDRTQTSPLGLMNGLAGASWACRRLGWQSIGTVAFESLLSRDWSQLGNDLYSGLPGVGLVLLAEADTRPELYEEALKIVETLHQRWQNSTAPTRVGTNRGGLLRGASGTALLALRLFEWRADPALLEVARHSLDYDLKSLIETPGGALHVNEGWRAVPYLGYGSAGIAMVIAQYLCHDNSPDRYRRTLEGIVRAACTPFTVQSGLLQGRAGLIHFLVNLEKLGLGNADTSLALRHHVSQLSLHAVRDADGLRFAGDGLLRLSCDLATGSAGVLAALLAYRSLQQPEGG